MAKRNKRLPLPIFILICAVLLYAMYTSISTLALAIWGDTVLGTVDGYGNRIDDRHSGDNRSRTISKGYFFAVGGREYRGYVIYMSDEAWPSLAEGETRSEHIRYLPFFPYINKPSALCEFDEMGDFAIVYHILAPIGCLFLLLLVVRAFKQNKKPKKSAKSAALTPPGDLGSACLGCGIPLPADVAFCPNCGAKARRYPADACVSCGAGLPEGAGFCINCGVARESPGT